MFMALLLSCKILGEGARALAAAADAREAGIALPAASHYCVVCALTRSRESPKELLQARRIWCLAWVCSQQGASAGRIDVVHAVVRSRIVRPHSSDLPPFQGFTAYRE